MRDEAHRTKFTEYSKTLLKRKEEKKKKQTRGAAHSFQQGLSESECCCHVSKRQR
jgi:hypothetical protein